MHKKFSILIISESGVRIRDYTISHLSARILLGVFICMLGGAVWLIFEYGNIMQKSLKIRALKQENQEMRQKYNKLQQFENEFNEFKHRLLKIASALDVQQISAIRPTKISFTPKDSFPNLASIVNYKEEGSRTMVSERRGEVPSIYPVKGWITQKFSSSHPAVDFAGEYGDSVVSTMNGNVESVTEDPRLGKVIEITNEKGFKTVYGHLTRTIVGEGIKVKCGDLIGFVGSTGESSAPHLHYEVKFNGIPHDPERYLSK